MALNLDSFCCSLRYLLRSVSFVAGECNDCLVASNFTPLSISISFSFALALVSVSLSSSIVPRITEVEMTGAASCQNEKNEAQAHEVPRCFLLSSFCLFLIIKHYDSERNARIEIEGCRLHLISSLPFVKPTRTHVCLLNVRFQNTIINGVKQV